MRSKLRRLCSSTNLPLGLVIVDYLQLMTASKETYSREQEVAQISRDLKNLAKEFDVPVLVAAQLNRKSEGRSNHLPTLSDLRESGAIEQDADVVKFIYRQDMYSSDPMTHTKKAQIIIAKNRNGPIDTVDLHYEPTTTKFTNITETDF